MLLDGTLPEDTLRVPRLARSPEGGPHPLRGRQKGPKADLLTSWTWTHGAFAGSTQGIHSPPLSPVPVSPLQREGGVGGMGGRQGHLKPGLAAQTSQPGKTRSWAQATRHAAGSSCHRPGRLERGAAGHTPAGLF